MTAENPSPPSSPTSIANVLPQAMAGVQAGSEIALLADIERRLAVWEAKRQLVFTILNSTDVVKMGNRLAKNRYASEKLLSVFGGRLELLKDDGGRPIIEKTMIDDDPDMGRIVIFTTFARYTRPDGIVFEAAGSFSSKDDFFALDHGSYRRFADIDLANVLSAAFTESQKKAIFRGCGLGDFDEGEQTQVLADSAKGHDFAGSAPKGAATSGDPIIGFGSQKGKKVSELTETKDITWYHKVYTENVNDPSKAKFAKQNRAVVDALAARMQAGHGLGGNPSAQGAPQGATDPGMEGARQSPDGTPSEEDLTKLSRGVLIGRAFNLVEKHAGKTGKAQSLFIRQLLVGALGHPGAGADVPGALTALSDEQLRAMLTLTAEQIETAKMKPVEKAPEEAAANG